jgi:hypothetical protein
MTLKHRLIRLFLGVGVTLVLMARSHMYLKQSGLNDEAIAGITILALAMTYFCTITRDL